MKEKIIKFIDAKIELPRSQDINSTCNEYYLVELEDYGIHKAMYLMNNNGEDGWYINYFAKITEAEVLSWCRI